MLLEMVDADIISKNNWLARDEECRERFEFRVLVTCDRFSLQQQRWGSGSRICWLSLPREKNSIFHESQKDKKIAALSKSQLVQKS